ncbi:MAG TPA: sensor histidine kinase [Gaiellaceae bacterium]|nr:sensor histidine kinase [Gaiellaceae bacterium]
MTARPARVPRLRLGQSPTPSDAIVAAVAFALTLAVLGGAHGSGRSLDALGVCLAAVACFPLLARRQWPLGVFALSAAASATLSGLDYGHGPPFGPTVALFFVALDERSRARVARTATVVVVMFGIHLAATAGASSGFPTIAVLGGIVIWGGAWMVGDQLRQRRRRRLELAERLERAERDTARERRLAAAEERTRIARDLHDSAAHAINVILVQAGAARLLQQRDPGAAQDALSTIEDVARETIGEIDHLVRGLREDNGSAAVEPPTGLAALDTLLERHRAAGLAIELRVDGETRLLPQRLDQAAYRILQEALTNVARHGDGSAEVDVHYGEGRLELTVSNTVPATSANTAGGGHGILGMRERASLLGGTLDAGHAAGRFMVTARLPYGPAEATA